MPCWQEGVGGCQAGPVAHATTWYMSSNVHSTGTGLSLLGNALPLYPAAPREPLIPPAWEQLQLAVP